MVMTMYQKHDKIIKIIKIIKTLKIIFEELLQRAMFQKLWKKTIVVPKNKKKL